MNLSVTRGLEKIEYNDRCVHYAQVRSLRHFNGCDQLGQPLVPPVDFPRPRPRLATTPITRHYAPQAIHERLWPDKHRITLDPTPGNKPAAQPILIQRSDSAPCIPRTCMR